MIGDADHGVEKNKEAVTARIDLPEDDLATVRCILSYLYFQDYSPGDQIAFWQTLRASVKSDMKPASSQTKVETEAQAYSHLKVYEAAGKYLIEPLRLLAKDRFISWVKANVLHGSLSGVFRQVLDSPMAHDLHGEITQILSENIVYCLNQDKMVETLEDYPKIAIAVLRNVATARAQLLERISRRPIH